MKIEFFFDFETRSHLDLKKVGSVKYATHPTTEATLLTWCFGRTSPVKAWRMGQPIPSELYDVAMNPEKYMFIAFNIMFDYLIWTQVFSKLIPGLKAPRIENLEDCMAMTSHFRVGASLEAAARILSLPFSKNKDGRTIMLKQCKPNKFGRYLELNTNEWERFEMYGIVDTKLLRMVYTMIPALPAAERWAWEWTFKRNLKGIKLDMDLVYELNDIIDQWIPIYARKFETLTTMTATVNSPVKCKEFFQKYYPEIEDMQADTVRDLLLDKRKVPKFVREALEIKDLAGGASLAKIKTAIRQNYQGRIYGNLAYAHAQTKRWAGRGLQVHNVPRVDDKKTDKIDFNLNAVSIVDDVKKKRETLKDPLGFVKNMLRRIFIPDRPDLRFYCGDWSKIEPTVLFWLAGLGTIPDDWYEDMAASIYDVPKNTIGKESEERQLGKSSALGCGYGMGHKKFKEDTLKKSGLDISEALAKRAVNTYRSKYKEVVDLWHSLESAMRHAVYGRASKVAGGKITVMPMRLPHKGIEIHLPSGSILYYHGAHIVPDRLIKVRNERGELVDELIRGGVSYISDEDGTPTAKKVYGGLLTEHVTSCLARDIILPALYNLEAAGFDILNLVHDEMWGQGEPGRDEEFERIMCINPHWCKDMKITAGMKNGWRYLK